MVGDVIILVGFVTLVLAILFMLFMMLPHALAPQPLLVVYQRQMLTLVPISILHRMLVLYITSTQNLTVVVVHYVYPYLSYRYVEVPAMRVLVLRTSPWQISYTLIVWPTGCQYTTSLRHSTIEVTVPFTFTNVTLILHEGRCRPVGIPVVFIPYAEMVRRGNILGIVVPK